MNLIRIMPAEESEMAYDDRAQVEAPAKTDENWRHPAGASIPIALTIAGSDSSGGAGIQADLKTFSALGVYGASVIVALTAQNTRGVSAIHGVPPAFVTQQMDAVFSDLDVAAVKIGMLASPDLIEAVVEGLIRHKARNIVLDPVMVAATGARLLEEDAIAVLRDRLMPLAALVTPNLPEAAALLDAPLAQDEQEMRVQAERLRSYGASAVLVKGGHSSSAESVDVLVAKGMSQRYAAARIETANTHGTGCTLSSAIAAGLARGESLGAAVDGAKAYVTAAIEASDRLSVGHGHGPVHHFHALWRA
jgi:hydroxymethylpyrimidine/phosphomethylpyrimidine kinase